MFWQIIRIILNNLSEINPINRVTKPKGSLFVNQSEMHLLYFILCSCTEIIFIHFEYIYLLKETDFACVQK